MSYDGPPPTEPPPPSYQAWPSYAPVYPTPVPPRPRRLVWLVSSTVVLLLLAAIVLAGFLGARAGRRNVAAEDRVVGSARCSNESPPAGADAAAVAYLAAVNRELVVQLPISDRISRTGRVTSIDMTDQIASDRIFIPDVKAIAFDPVAQPKAATLVDAITGYDDFLNLAASSASYYIAHQSEDAQLQQVRSGAAADLRTALGLPPSTCQLSRP